MGSLFDELAAEEAAAGTRRIHTQEQDADAGPSFPKLSGIEQFQTLFMEELRRDDVSVRIPDDDTIARLRGSGWRHPRGGRGNPSWSDWLERDPDVDCVRWFFEKITIPVEGLLNAHVIQARDMVHRLVSSRNGGTFHHTLMQSLATSNGQWVPVEVAFRRSVKPFLDGFKEAQFRPPTDQGTVTPLTADDLGLSASGVVSGWKQAVNVNKETLEIVIRWADVRNAQTARLDANGQVVADMHVKVQAPTATTQGTDPALLAILTKLAEGKAAPTEPEPKADDAEEPKRKWVPKPDPAK